MSGIVANGPVHTRLHLSHLQEFLSHLPEWRRFNRSVISGRDAGEGIPPVSNPQHVRQATGGDQVEWNALLPVLRFPRVGPDSRGASAPLQGLQQQLLRHGADATRRDDQGRRKADGDHQPLEGEIINKNVYRAVYGSPDKPLRIADIEIPCYVLEDGRRVIIQSGILTALDMSQGTASKRWG